jgi:signal transduction histidine kinase
MIETGVPSLVVLIVEDNPADAELMSLRLGCAAPMRGVTPPQLLLCGTAEAACRLLRHRNVDVVILDLTLPDAHGLQALHRVRDAAPNVPVVVVTGRVDPRLGLEALRAGAQDFLQKPAPGGAAMMRILHYAYERHRLLLRGMHRAVEARDRVVSVVSHDLRSPLSAIQICANALLDPDPAPPSGVRHVAELIQRSAAWMQQMLGDLLDRTSLETGKVHLHRRPIAIGDLVSAVEGVFAPIAYQRAITLVVDTEPDLPPIDGDPDRLLQAMSNLMSNALKFTPSGGRVSLCVAAEPVRFDPEQRGPARREIRFSIEDSGEGIAPENLERVFDWFWQAPGGRCEGAGLGLGIAKGLIEAHDGCLLVRSVPGQGSTFWFTLLEANAVNAFAEMPVA